jgi:aminopeptidase N
VNARDLAVTNVYLFDENFEAIEYNLRYETLSYLDFFVAYPKKPLEKGKKYNVFFSFLGGVMRKDGKGFFISSYGSDEWSASFQASPTYARQVFPCFDEPQFRSRFLMKVTHSNYYHAISSMPLNITTPYQEPYTVSWFKVSDPIPVSQVGFFVSKFHYIEDKVGSITLRVYAKRSSISDQEAKLALETAKKLVGAFEAYLGIPLNLQKVDFAAVKSSTLGEKFVQ